MGQAGEAGQRVKIADGACVTSCSCECDDDVRVGFGCVKLGAHAGTHELRRELHFLA